MVKEEMKTMIEPAQQKKENSENTNVVCKMFVKGKPNNLIEIVKNILLPLNVKNSNGLYTNSLTPDYAVTILVEKLN